jgi:predicted dehydrogenase
MPDTKPLRWGILGTGRILAKLMGGFQLARGATLTAIASREPGRAAARARELGIPKAHGSYRALLDDPEIDIVLNALHNGLHCEWTIAALAAGKHVLCEKPLACSADEAGRMFAAAAKHRRWLMEGFMYRFHPQIAEVCRRVTGGELGEVIHIRAHYLGQGRERKNLRYRRDTGGGALLDLGCYCVNLARLIAGREPQQVLAHARFDPETDIDMTLAGTLEFDKGLTAHIGCSFESEGVFGAEIVGTEAKLFVPHPWLPPAWPAEFIITRRGVSETVRVEDANAPHHFLAPFALEIEHLNNCARTNTAPAFPPHCDAERDSLAQAKVHDALLKSARSGTAVGL